MQSGAESMDTIASWWQEVSTLSSLPKNHLGLKVRQAKNTNILLPNREKVQIQFSRGDKFGWLSNPFRESLGQGHQKLHDFFKNSIPIQIHLVSKL